MSHLATSKPKHGLFAVAAKTLRHHKRLVVAIFAALAVVAFFLLVQTLPVRNLADWVASDRVEVFGAWYSGRVRGRFRACDDAFAARLAVHCRGRCAVWSVDWNTHNDHGLGALAAIVFLLASCGGKNLLHKLRQYPRIRAIYNALGDGGWKVVAAVRLSHGLPFGLQNFLFGLSSIPFWTYLITTWLVTLPGIFC